MSQRYWDAKMETLPVEQRRELRAHRLHWQVRRCWDGSPFYRARLEAAGLDAALSGGFEAWQRLPVLMPNDLPAVAEWAVAPESWWTRLDGVPGQPVRVVTDGDAIQQADLAARALWAAGARPGESFPSPAAPPDQLFQALIAAGAHRIGVSLTDAGETHAPLVPTLSRPFLLPLASRCREGERLHWIDDHFLIEIVNPGSGRPVPNGSPGALVVTDLAREGSPLLRFWVGHETLLDERACQCGRTSAWTSTIRPLI